VLSGSGKTRPGDTDRTSRWHLWGPALIAALVGPVPGTIALLDQPPDTEVAITQPQGYIVAQGRGYVQFTVRVVNDSRHDMVLEDGVCRFRGELAGMEAIDPRQRHRGKVVTDLFDYGTVGAIHGTRLGESEGIRVACRFPVTRTSRALIPLDYDTNSNASTLMTFVVNTSDGREWSWHGPVNVFNPGD
jgi:hypothetical protein